MAKVLRGTLMNNKYELKDDLYLWKYYHNKYHDIMFGLGYDINEQIVVAKEWSPFKNGWAWNAIDNRWGARQIELFKAYATSKDATPVASPKLFLAYWDGGLETMRQNAIKREIMKDHLEGEIYDRDVDYFMEDR